jgi:hypothetical protein
MDGVYRVEFENLDGVPINGGIVVFDRGRFEGGTGGYHYAGTFGFKAGNRFRGEGSVIRHAAAAQKIFGVFGDGCSEFDMILIGFVEGDHVRGLLVCLDERCLTMRFRLARKIRFVEKGVA